MNIDGYLHHVHQGLAKLVWLQLPSAPTMPAVILTVFELLAVVSGKVYNDFVLVELYYNCFRLYFIIFYNILTQKS